MWQVSPFFCAICSFHPSFRKGRAGDGFLKRMSKKVYFSRLIDRDDEIKLQHLLERCADYFSLAYNRPVAVNEAENLFQSLPAGKTAEDKSLIGIFDRENIMTGLIEMIRDYPKENAWFLKLMLLAPEARGQGIGKKIYDDTEEWAYDLGAKVIQLEIPQWNKSAYKFWSVLGFKEINRENGTIVMLRSLIAEG
jgi:GNAT superfamily N-acetyltransferase